MESIWHRSAKMAPKPPLAEDVETGVAVIGGGMAGILTAALLEEAGVRTVVLEADRVGGGQTGNTTAKVTAQHGLIYHKLEQTLGPESARLYAVANQSAVESYQRMVDERGIRCAWERLPAYLYALEAEDLLSQEAAAQERAGLPVRLTEDPGLPFPVRGAVRCGGQAQFHPLWFLHALAEGLTVYEHTRVLEVDGGLVRTGGGTVRAEYVVFCCHFPFVNAPGYYFARMHQERSYVLALAGAPALAGMYYSADRDGLSLRRAGTLLLAGSGSHRTGENREGGRYDALRRSASLLLPGVEEVCRWSAQDCMTLDGVPYVGQFSASTPGWYVATGFGKWGMTGSMAAAVLLRDQILGQANAWEKLFSPQRFTPAASAARLLDNGLHALRDLGRLPLAPARAAAEALPPGHGGVAEVEGEKAGVYKAPDGTLHVVSLRCPHLGCQLEWNPDEQSWDCPCHGSRFDFQGRLLSGPAQEGLEAHTLLPEAAMPASGGADSPRET